VKFWIFNDKYRMIDEHFRCQFCIDDGAGFRGRDCSAMQKPQPNSQFAAAQSVRHNEQRPRLTKSEALELGSGALTGTKPMPEIALNFKQYLRRLPVFFGSHHERSHTQNKG
jgi:hypothetical protein